MRGSCVLALAALLLARAAPAPAAVLPFTGTLQLAIGTRPVVSLPGSGSVVVNGSLGGVTLTSFTIPAGAFRGAVSTPIPNAAPLSGAILAGGTVTQMTHLAVPKSIDLSLERPTGSLSNAPGSFSALPGPGGGGVMPLFGAGLICLFDVCSVSPSANLVVPLTPVGQGGTVFHQGVVDTTIVGAPWTAATAAVGTVTMAGFSHGPGSLAGTTAQPGGVVSLVVPVFMSISLPSFPVAPVFTRMTLHFVPEPGAMLLLGAGLAALAVLGRRLARGQ